MNGFCRTFEGETQSINGNQIKYNKSVLKDVQHEGLRKHISFFGYSETVALGILGFVSH